MGRDSNKESIRTICLLEHSESTVFTSKASLRKKQQGVETVAAAIIDHFAVILRLTIDISRTPRGKGYLRMITSYLRETIFQQTIKENWVNWQEHIKYYPNRVMWWGRYVKRMLRQLFSHEGAAFRRDRMEMENFITLQ